MKYLITALSENNSSSKRLKTTITSTGEVQVMNKKEFKLVNGYGIFRSRFYQLITTALIIFMLVGCEKDTRIKESSINYRRVCLDGIIYYESTYILAPAFNNARTLKTCKFKP